MKIKKSIIILAIIISAVIGATTAAASNGLTFIKAIEAYRERKELHVLSEEEFTRHIETRDAGEVLFASSIATAFNKNIEDIYALIDANDHDYKKVHEILQTELGDGRKTPLSLPSHPSEEEAAKITETLKMGIVLSDPRGNFIDNTKINLVSQREARKTFAEASFLYAFDEVEFEELLSKRCAGSVLLAGNLAHNFGMTVEYVLGAFDSFNSDYHGAYDVLYDEWMDKQ